MAAYIKTLKDASRENIIYPHTKSEAVYRDDNTTSVEEALVALESEVASILEGTSGIGDIYETKVDAQAKFDEVKAYVDEKAVQVDWNQNDENGKGYIKNRPFYDGRYTVKTEDVTINGTTGPYGFMKIADIPLDFDFSKIVAYTLVSNNGANFIDEPVEVENYNGCLIAGPFSLIDSYDYIGDIIPPEFSDLGLYTYMSDEEGDNVSFYYNFTLESGELVQLEPKYVKDMYCDNRSDTIVYEAQEVIASKHPYTASVLDNYKWSLNDIAPNNEYLIVEWDGVQYKCELKRLPILPFALCYVGNSIIQDRYNLTFSQCEFPDAMREDTGEPFFIYFGDQFIYIGSCDDEVHSVKIYGNCGDVQQIPSKYVCVDWNQHDPNGRGYVNNRTHYIDRKLVSISEENITVTPLQNGYVKILDDIDFNIDNLKSVSTNYSLDTDYWYCTGGMEMSVVLDHKGFGWTTIIGKDTHRDYGVYFRDQQEADDWALRNVGEVEHNFEKGLYFRAGDEGTEGEFSYILTYETEEIVKLDPSYVEGMYYTEGGRITVVESAIIPSGKYDYVIGSNVELKNGREYIIKYDDVEYKFVCNNGRIGAKWNYYYENIDFSEYPFAIAYPNDLIGTCINCRVPDTNGHTISLYYDTEEVIHKIDPKYLPESKGTSRLIDGQFYGSIRHVDAMPSNGEEFGKEDYYLGYNAIALGPRSQAAGNNSFAIGYETHAEGLCSTAEGTRTFAIGEESHAEGWETQAIGNRSHSEGNSTIAEGNNSHAEGFQTTSVGENSHAEGIKTKAIGENSHAEGYYTTANASYQHVQGKYNIPDDISAHIVGNGTYSDSLSNAHTLDWSGNAWFAGDVYVGSTSGTNKDDGSKRLATVEYVDTSISTIAPDSIGAAKTSHTHSANDLILTDTSTGTQYKLSVTDGKLTLSTI